MANIVQDKDGVYRWVYEFNLLTNPTIFITVLKVLLISMVIVFGIMLVMMLPDLVNGYVGFDDMLGTLQSGGLFILFFFVLASVGYAVYAIMQGGKYCAVFTMDEEGITHKQLPKQYKKAEVVSALNVLAGIATGNPTLAGIGLTSARDSMTSTFDAVRSVKGSRAFQVIRVNEPLAKNQIYVEREDYDFVFGYIASHCPHAKVRG